MKTNRINYNTQTFNYTGLKNKNSASNIFKPSFTGQYEIDGNSIISREQVFTLGTLMNNFWLYDTRNTFFDIKRKNVMGKFTVKVNDLKDKSFEDIMQRNNIKFTKKDSNN